MKTPRLFARPQLEARGLNSETILRYGAATVVTLIALAAAQLILPTRAMLILGVVTLLGTPVSLWMRFHQMRIAGVSVPRPLWNALTVIASLVASAIFLRGPLRNVLFALEGGVNEAAIVRIGETEPMQLLVQLFLIFAAFRSFSLISDKDATLTTVPSFSVLLLLIPVYPNIEVVCYFLVWTLVATMLFALDHSSEIRERATATVAAPSPGQGVKLAARSLAGVLSISLLAAVTLSGLLTARDPRDGSSSDSAISLLAMRLTRFGAQSQETSMQNGPERQIDFSSGTSLPSRAILWRTRVLTLDGRPVNPVYWRLFTLSNYDGAIWSQENSGVRSIERTQLTRAQWPPLSFLDGPTGRNGDGISTREAQAAPARPQPVSPADRRGAAPRNRTPRAPRPSRPERARRATFGRDRSGFSQLPQGFALARAQPKLERSFGPATEIVRYSMMATRTSLGFVPLLPAPVSLEVRNGDQGRASVRPDGGVDMSVIGNGQIFRAVSRTPKLAEYGFLGDNPPSEKIAPDDDSPKLSARARALNLALPAVMPARVRQFAQTATRTANAESSNYARAQLLARATRRGAIYTLRPPAIPAGRDATDFFLFESRRGYCTYFAGALTVLCRAQGIPARVVSGFVSPDQESRGESVIRDANAHAWTEVWVENWGWATVDATPPGDRGDNAPTFLENWSDLASASFDSLLRWSLARWPFVLAVASLLAAAFCAWRFRHGIARRLGRVVVEDAEASRRQIAADYARVSRQLARRFRPRDSWETPDEWLQAARLALPQLPFEPLQTLTALYVRARFSPRELGPDAAQSARRARASVVWPKRKRASN